MKLFEKDPWYAVLRQNDSEMRIDFRRHDPIFRSEATVPATKNSDQLVVGPFKTQGEAEKFRDYFNTLGVEQHDFIIFQSKIGNAPFTKHEYDREECAAESQKKVKVRKRERSPGL